MEGAVQKLPLQVIDGCVQAVGQGLACGGGMDGRAHPHRGQEGQGSRAALCLFSQLR